MTKNAKTSSVPRHRIVARKPITVVLREKLVCPYCGNQEEFYEVTENAYVMVHYLQNEDGTFVPIGEDMEVSGPVRFFCGRCQADLSHLRDKL
ncbi:hypothetical protein [Thermosulfurimonas dismutans]|uniref:Uncharacterized protein n=1 Tax=Thermosulfurimonas dismutans TaxID=999894 RepID=A0A179D704_9BACT|nr:hypothetical protein [Thermosulfurimonas dismutans]OAQ21571.1 hypothetical protein TDIS_0089 [Thermosulfurimonas dismutans]